ncbi:MAG: hypothetical protein JOZ02_23930 [Acidobacteria bacterium]|nr:hypothetical protein [Acidobacteriota bacterium]
MDWKNKHFEREAVFQAQRDLVFEAARSFAAESLAGWQLADTSDGFEARGHSASHAATAKFRIEPAPFGTKVAVTLLVERAGPLGFMLFDVGGYYDRQMSKWLEGIQWHLHQGLTSTTQPESSAQARQAIPKPAGTQRLYVGCLVALFVFPLFLYCVSAVVGLLTGNLYLVGRRGGTIHGPWARIISGISLTIFVLIGLRVLKTRKKARGQT